MKLTRILPLSLVIAPVALAMAACQPPVDPSACNGTIGAITVSQVVVPANATCTLNGTIVQGGVDVGQNATLVANGVRVESNLLAGGHRSIRVTGASTVQGDVQVKDGGTASIIGARIQGNTQFDANLGLIDLRDNRIGGDVKVEENRGGATIFNNQVTNNLQCVQNVPAPTGGGNTVGGTRDGQCAGF